MKPVILTFTRYYLPGYRAGGPIRTISNMVDKLSDDFEFRIVSLDRDLGSTVPYADVEAAEWMPRGKALVLHLRPSDVSLRRFASIVRSTPHDVIYLNSFFDPRFTQQVLINRRLARPMGRPVVLAPRGEFSAGALELKRFKKSIFIALAERLGIYEGLTWQASSVMEAADIRRALPISDLNSVGTEVVVSGHIALAQDIAEPGDMAASKGSSSRYPSEPMKVCFLSRISPKKNLDFALRVLSLVSAPVRFTIYGPIEDSRYWESRKALIATLPKNVQVVHGGSVDHSRVVEMLAQHHLFLFPTRGENFGHVIHEALRAGLPLLISDQTPWQQLQKKGVGWDLSLDCVEEFARRVEEVCGWPQAVRDEYSTRARMHAATIGSDDETLRANRKIFFDAIARSA